MSDGTNVKLSFEGLVPHGNYLYNLSNYDGYQGFNFSEMDLITKQGIEHHGWMDTGYGSVLHGDAEAITYGNGNGGFATVGYILSSYAGETFNLKSGIFAAARYPTLFTVFETYGADGKLKATVEVTLNESAKTINFANYGHDFKNIVKIQIQSWYGTAGGAYNVAMDNLKAHWNGAIPGSGARAHHAHVSHPVLAAMAAQSHFTSDRSSSGDVGTDCQHSAGYHGDMASLVSLTHHGGGLTSEFALPQPEHFGI